MARAKQICRTVVTNKHLFKLHADLPTKKTLIRTQTKGPEAQPTTTTPLSKVRALIPPVSEIADSISCLGGRQQLTVSVLSKALESYFGRYIEVKGNDIYIKRSSTKPEAAKAYFSGAKNAVIEDHKFALVVHSPACSAGITLERADGTDLLARAIHDVDSLLAVLSEFWPEN